VPTYQDRDEHDLSEWYAYFQYYRYLFNFFLIGVPYLIIAGLLSWFNIWFNMYLNDYWCEGNLYLLFNSIFATIQLSTSVIVIFELPMLMRTMKAFRMYSFIAAIIYDIVWFGFLMEFDRLLELTEYSTAEVLTVFFIAYNLVMNVGNAFISTSIILKEISMEFV
jgi:hypothetical protein